MLLQFLVFILSYATSSFILLNWGFYFIFDFGIELVKEVVAGGGLLFPIFVLYCLRVLQLVLSVD